MSNNDDRLVERPLDDGCEVTELDLSDTGDVRAPAILLHSEAVERELVAEPVGRPSGVGRARHTVRVVPRELGGQGARGGPVERRRECRRGERAGSGDRQHGEQERDEHDRRERPDEAGVQRTLDRAAPRPPRGRGLGTTTKSAAGWLHRAGYSTAAQQKETVPDSSSTILLVDDEDAIQSLLTYPLERDGYRVVQARDGEEALRRFADEDVDLVILDIMLPRVDGLEVCRRLRAESTVPIIMLTARDDELDKVLGPRARGGRLHHEALLDPGVPQPGARPAASGGDAAPLRAAGGGDRSRRRGDRPSPADGRRCVAPPWRSRSSSSSSSPCSQASPGIVFSRRQLLERIRGSADYREPRTIDVHVRHLREKIERDAREPELILTVRGAGYRFRD